MAVALVRVAGGGGRGRGGEDGNDRDEG